MYPTNQLLTNRALEALQDSSDAQTNSQPASQPPQPLAPPVLQARDSDERDWPTIPQMMELHKEMLQHQLASKILRIEMHITQRNLAMLFDNPRPEKKLPPETRPS